MHMCWETLPCNLTSLYLDFIRGALHRKVLFSHYPVVLKCPRLALSRASSNAEVEKARLPEGVWAEDVH